MAAPTRAFTTTIPYATRTVSSAVAFASTLTAAVGDVIVVKASTEDAPYTLTISDNSGGAMTWVLQQSDTTVSHGPVYIWTCVVASALSSVTVSLTISITTAHGWGARMNQWTGSAGVGTS